MSACYAVESSLKDSLGNPYQADPTPRARYMRNIALGLEFLMSHIVHFYGLAALDYVQGPGRELLHGNAGGTLPLPVQSGPWTPDYNPGFYFDDGQAHAAPWPPIAGKISLTRDDDFGIWNDVILDYVLALQMRRRCMEAVAPFTGRWPMYSNLVCGGVTNPDMSDPRDLDDVANFNAAINLLKEILYKGKLNAVDWEGTLQTGNGTTANDYDPLAGGKGPDRGTILHFIRYHYLPMVETVAAVYSNYDNPANFGIQQPFDNGWNAAVPGQGFGAGVGNFLSYGAFHDDAAEVPLVDPTIHPGHLLKADIYDGSIAGSMLESDGFPINTATNVAMAIKDRVMEYIDYSWYDDLSETPHPRPPDCGYTRPNRDKDNGVAGAGSEDPYTWVKAPRVCKDLDTLVMSTTSTIKASAGATRIYVNANGPFTVNDIVLVGEYSAEVGRRELRRVSAKGSDSKGNYLDVDKALQFDHPIGSGFPPNVIIQTTMPVEVGPLARMVNSGFAGAQVKVAPYQPYPGKVVGICPTRPNAYDLWLGRGGWINASWPGGWKGLAGVGGLGVPLVQTIGISAIDRHRARVAEALYVINALLGITGDPATIPANALDYTGPGNGWVPDLSTLSVGKTVDKNWVPPQSGERMGWGLNEAPRGALMHYVKYKDNRITKYQCVVPTTWNASPRDVISPHNISDTVNDVTTADVTTPTLGEAQALLTELKADYDLHIADAAFHRTPDTANATTLPVGGTEVTARALAKEIKDNFNKHLTENDANNDLTADDPVHNVSDLVNGVTAADATNLATLQTLANQIKAKFNNHLPSATQKGAIEEALVGLYISGRLTNDGRNGGLYQLDIPVEPLRVTHSFDPCIACAVHKVNGKKVKAHRIETKKAKPKTKKEVRRR